MAIDASIPLQAQGINVAKMLDEGSQIGQLWQQQRLNKELDRIYNESQGDVNKMLSLGQQSQMARYIVPQLQAQQAASQKNLLDQQKTLAEIANTNAQASERTANAGSTSFDRSQKQYGAIQGAISQAAMTGDKTVAMLALNGLQRAGVISPEDYTNNVAILNAMQPEDVKKWASAATFGNTKDQGAYLFQTANNAADNATSTANNIRTTDASRYATDTTAATADKNRAQDKILAEQRIALERGEFETMTGTDGKAYAVYKDGRVEPLLLKSGEAFTPQPKGNSGQPKLSDKALQLVNDLNVQLSTASQNSSKINGLINDVQSGRLNLSAANQLGAKARNAIGLSDENSRGVENFQTALNQAVNDVLMMAKGTQTEGDANRAAQVIAANPPRDNAAALQALQRLAAVQNNTIAVLNQNINGIYENYGLSRSQGAPKQSAQAGASRAKLNNILFGK
ncbi:hypothetical protein [Acinetobacter pittii]|uniref:hypothetical protein n=1 Tax=Acinetobacter pittii TaxID=48296 RepID=UPI001F197AD0|nr:hypothetical protein [Acinetobacter pittii]MCE6238334.1 hypothetical protein [Acinetobacter pittii]MCE6689647.1 hypothetical protein [Acinetobacter pittii]MCE6697861.1 hypothetical protein [Acinetobacter pittii]